MLLKNLIESDQLKLELNKKNAFNKNPLEIAYLKRIDQKQSCFTILKIVFEAAANNRTAFILDLIESKPNRLPFSFFTFFLQVFEGCELAKT